MSDDIKSLLQDAASRPSRDVDLFQARRRARLLRLMRYVTGSAFTVLAAGLTFGVANLPGDNERATTASLPPARDVQAHVSTRMDVSGQPLAIDAADGTVWVAVEGDPGRDSIVRVNANSNDVDARIQLDADIDQVAADATGVWVSVIARSGEIATYRIDEASNDISATVQGIGGELEILDDTVWALEQYTRSEKGSYVLKQLSTDGDVLSTATLDRPPLDIATYGDSVWALLATTSGDVVGASGVAQIDVATGDVVREVDVDSHFIRLVVDSDYAWVPGWLHDFASVEGADDKPTITRIATSTGVVEESNPSVSFAFRPFDFDDTGVWFLGGPEEPQGVCHVSRSTLQVDECVDPGATAEATLDPAAYDPSNRTIWVSLANGQVARIDLVSE